MNLGSGGRVGEWARYALLGEGAVHTLDDLERGEVKSVFLSYSVKDLENRGLGDASLRKELGDSTSRSRPRHLGE